MKKRKAVPEQTLQARFEQAVFPHLDAAYNLARWLTCNDQDAEDRVQEAYIQAFKSFAGFHGTTSRAWLLTIVRTTCYTWLQQKQAPEHTTSVDEALYSRESEAFNPENLLLSSANAQFLREVLEELPVEFREVILLRELEGLSYKEIATIMDVPLGTVMSRLVRARKRLQQGLTSRRNKELYHEL